MMWSIDEEGNLVQVPLSGVSEGEEDGGEQEEQEGGMSVEALSGMHTEGEEGKGGEGEGRGAGQADVEHTAALPPLSPLHDYDDDCWFLSQ